jgi:hypothetical protein
MYAIPRQNFHLEKSYLLRIWNFGGDFVGFFSLQNPKARTKKIMKKLREGLSQGLLQRHGGWGGHKV